MGKLHIKLTSKSYTQESCLRQMSSDNEHIFPIQTSHCMPDFEHHPSTVVNHLQLATHTKNALAPSLPASLTNNNILQLHAMVQIVDTHFSKLHSTTTVNSLQVTLSQAESFVFRCGQQQQLHVRYADFHKDIANLFRLQRRACLACIALPALVPLLRLLEPRSPSILLEGVERKKPNSFFKCTMTGLPSLSIRITATFASLPS